MPISVSANGSQAHLPGYTRFPHISRRNARRPQAESLPAGLQRAILERVFHSLTCPKSTDPGQGAERWFSLDQAQPDEKEEVHCMPGIAELRRLLLLGCCLPLLFLLASCQFSRSPFSRTAQNISATFAAAQITLRYLHEGKLTQAYAHTDFASYVRQLQGVPQQLTPAQGGPTRAQITRLLAVYWAAMPAIRHPCFQTSCDWHGQMITLKKAGSAFLEASGP